MGNKYIGLGTTLSVSTDGTTTYGHTIGQIQSISGPGLTSDDLETTTLDGSILKTFVKGLIDLGELTVNYLVDIGSTSNHRILHQLAKVRTTARWKLVGSTTTYVEEFDGYVKTLSREITAAELISGSFGIKLSGDSTSMVPYTTTYSS